MGKTLTNERQLSIFVVTTLDLSGALGALDKLNCMDICGIALTTTLMVSMIIAAMTPTAPCGITSSRITALLLIILSVFRRYNQLNIKHNDKRNRNHSEKNIFIVIM